MRVKMQLQPNAYSCMAASFAMALRLDVVEVIERLGHDGSTIVFPDRPEPNNRRGYHLQEMVDLCIEEGYSPVVIECCPVLPASDVRLWQPTQEEVRVMSYLEKNSGVLLGMREDRAHAVYWYHPKQRIYDPVGITYKIDKFAPMMVVLI